MSPPPLRWSIAGPLSWLRGRGRFLLGRGDGRPRPLDPRDEAMMRRAIELAERARRLDEVPVGAVVYRGGEILGRGYNLRERSGDPTAHAEMIALREAARSVGGWRLSGCSMAVTLEPCPMCAGAIVHARVDRLIYGAADPKMGAVRTLYRICEDRRLNHRVRVRPGVMAEVCGGMLRRFFRERRKKKKAAARARGSGV